MQNKAKKYIFCLLTVLFSFGVAIGQNHSIQGLVADSTVAPLSGATIILMQAADSVMANFAMTDAAGKFELRSVQSGDYLLQVSYIGYQASWQTLKLEGKGTLSDLGEIVLEGNIQNLETVTISGERSPLTIKKDTLEFNAGAFKTQPNAVVEDLLKQLPGVEVDENGNVKAQGEEVKRVTIDGKEFFGNDPKIATKNLPADAVEKVQVFDKKSDRAEFSGIDDGQREKTINLSLKEDKKKGLFGNVKGGYGDQNRFNGRGNLNRFSPRTQFSVIGLANNTNDEGFSISDYITFMGGIQSFMDGGGRIKLSIDSETSPIPIGQGANAGINTVYSGGTNFNHEISEKTEINGNYFFSSFNREVDRTSRRQDFLSDGSSFVSEQASKDDSGNRNHRMDITLDHKFDSLQSIRIRSSIRFSANEANNTSGSALYGIDGLLANEGQNMNLSEGSQNNWEASALYKRKLGKPGRTISVDAAIRLNDRNQDGRLEALNSFFEGGLLQDELLIDQDRIQEEQVQSFNSGLSYTEPLGKRRYLEWNYYFQQMQQDASQEVYDEGAAGTPGMLNQQLSNHYISDYLYHKAGMNFLLNREKFNFSVGINLQQSSLDGHLVLSDTYIRQDFSNWLPTFSFDYSFDNSHNTRIFYGTSMREPSIRELQPILDNANPLSLYIGNPELKPEYQHRLNWNYLFFDQFSYLNIFANVSMQYTENKIQYAQTIDDQFIRTTRPVNVADFVNTNANISLGTPIRPLKSRINVNLGWQYSEGPNFINGIENNTRTQSQSAGLRLDNRKKEKIDVFISTRLRRNTASYSLNEEYNQTFRDYKHAAGFTWNWERTRLQFQSNMDYIVYAGRGEGFDREVPLWQASVSRFFMKDKRIQASFSVRDILNKNIGISRNAILNYILDEQVNALGRYMMVSLQYTVKGFAGTGGGFQVRINE